MLPKIKLISIETLILQALIDMEISYEKFVTILKEKYRYEKFKENLRSENENKTVWDWTVWDWAYFPKNKLGIEVDEYNHEGRNFEYEQSRQLMKESYGIAIIRTNLDAADFDMNRLINQAYMQIIKATKKPLIDDLSKRLLELGFESNHSIKSICLKWIAKNILPSQKIKNT